MVFRGHLTRLNVCSNQQLTLGMPKPARIGGPLSGRADIQETAPDILHSGKRKTLSLLCVACRGGGFFSEGYIHTSPRRGPFFLAESTTLLTLLFDECVGFRNERVHRLALLWLQHLPKRAGEEYKSDQR